MKQNEAERLAANLISKFGLAVAGKIENSPEGQLLTIEPLGIHHNDGFKVVTRIRWRSLTIEFVPGKFAGELVAEMANASKDRRGMFSIIVQQILDEKGVITFLINDVVASPTRPSEWPEKWKSVVFVLKRSPIEINTDDHAISERNINLWVERFFGCLIQLIPLEQNEESIEEPGLPEGAQSTITVNRYERNRYNRSMCINFHGVACKVCGMTFSEKYGEIGIGFIHVHHVVPVSSLGSNYVVNPIKDLVPVCPNCHSMLHTSDPPLSVESLRSLLEKDDEMK